jgi:gluconate kinase
MTLLFVTGQSGGGKTSLGNNLKDKCGFVHFDGDVFSAGADATRFTGVPTADMLASTDRTLKQTYKDCAEHAFGGLFAGHAVPLARWTPFVDLLIANVKEKLKELPSGTSLVITWSVYTRELRDYIGTALPGVKFIVLNDCGHNAAKRKAAQTIATAQARGQTLAEFLAGFGVAGYDATEEGLVKRVSVYQRGFEPADADEFGIDVDASTSLDDVLTKVVSHFSLKSTTCEGSNAVSCERVATNAIALEKQH